jgi:hypothetical protein
VDGEKSSQRSVLLVLVLVLGSPFEHEYEYDGKELDLGPVI